MDVNLIHSKTGRTLTTSEERATVLAKSGWVRDDERQALTDDAAGNGDDTNTDKE